MNSYNLYEEDHYGTILYRAVAYDREQVEILAKDAGIDIKGLVIELEKMNVRDEIGRPYKPYIEDALIR